MSADPMLLRCLAHIKCENLLPVFIENEIDFHAFKTMSEDEVTTLVGGKLGPKKILWQEIQRIRELDAKWASGQQQQLLPIPQTDGGAVKNATNAQPQQSVGTPGDDSKAIPEADKSAMEKYGFTATNFAQTILIGTVQKHIIDNYTHPLFVSTLGAAKPTDTKPTTTTEGGDPGVPTGEVANGGNSTSDITAGTNVGIGAGSETTTAPGIGSRSFHPIPQEMESDAAKYFGNSTTEPTEMGIYDNQTDIDYFSEVTCDATAGGDFNADLMVNEDIPVDTFDTAGDAAGEGDLLSSIVGGIVNIFVGGDEV